MKTQVLWDDAVSTGKELLSLKHVTNNNDINNNTQYHKQKEKLSLYPPCRDKLDWKCSSTQS